MLNMLYCKLILLQRGSMINIRKCRKLWQYMINIHALLCQKRGYIALRLSVSLTVSRSVHRQFPFIFSQRLHISKWHFNIDLSYFGQIRFWVRRNIFFKCIVFIVTKTVAIPLILSRMHKWFSWFIMRITLSISLLWHRLSADLYLRKISLQFSRRMHTFWW